MIVGFAALATALAGETPDAPPPLILSACNDAAAWAGGTVDTEADGSSGIRWVPKDAPSLTLKNVPSDWSAYTTLHVRLHSRQALSSRFIIYVGSENAATEGMDYFSAPISLDFTGWRTFDFPFVSMGASRNPLGWDTIDAFRFIAEGWGNQPHPEAVLLVGEVSLSWEPPETGPRLSDQDFFAALDLERQDLASVRTAVEAGDTMAARQAFAAHIRSRETPVWFFDWRSRPRHESRPEGIDTTAADKIVRHELTSCGIAYAFGDDIDWSINPTELKYSEWTWQLSRHPFWTTLGHAYWATGNEVYASDFVYQMTDWITDNPVPVHSSGNTVGSRWRTIETGIRMFSSWPDSFFRFLSSPSFSDDALMTMVKSMVEHARHLMAHPTGNNWLAMEMNGLFHVGVLFPEFHEAGVWRQTASDRLYEEMNTQVYPDGAQVELATGYHGVSLHNFLGTLRLARLNDISLPGDYAQRLEKMYDYYLKLTMPDGRYPGLNDAGFGSSIGPLKQGLELFPERTDFGYVASQGTTGTTPDFTSIHFPYAGWGVMRSGWGTEDLYLHYEYGPYGAGHQHEDKLSFVVHAYGRRLLTEAGVYAYDSSQWRRYVLSSRAHNTVMVDGMEQNRRGLRETYVTADPLPNRWVSNPQFDLAEGWFDEGFGPERDRRVTHRRAILFIKPEYWLVVDRLTPSDDVVHRYDAMFHFDTEEARATHGVKGAVTTYGEGANLAILALNPAAVSVDIISGQEKPMVQGWLPAGGYRVRPVATPVFTAEGTGQKILPWMILPLRAGQTVSVTSVAVAEENGEMVFSVDFDDGRRHTLRVPVQEPAVGSTGALRWSETREGRVSAEIGVPE